MYKFFSFFFFTCAASLISLLFIAPDTDAKWKFIWPLLGISTLGYFLFFFFVLITSIFKVRSDTTLSKVILLFTSKIKFISGKTTLIQNIITFIFILFVGFVTLGAAFRFVVYMSIRTFPDQIMAIWNETKSKSESKTNIDTLKKEISDLRERSFEASKRAFFQNNNKSYKSEIVINKVNYDVKILYSRSEEGTGFNSRLRYTLFICPTETADMAESGCMATYRGNPDVVFDSSENIVAFDANTYRIASFKTSDKPAIIITVTTDKKESEYLIYPQYLSETGDSLYGAFPTIESTGYGTEFMNTFESIYFSQSNTEPIYMYATLNTNSQDINSIEKLGYSLSKYKVSDEMTFVFDRDSKTNLVYISQVASPEY